MEQFNVLAWPLADNKPATQIGSGFTSFDEANMVAAQHVTALSGTVVFPDDSGAYPSGSYFVEVVYDDTK